MRVATPPPVPPQTRPADNGVPPPGRWLRAAIGRGLRWFLDAAPVRTVHWIAQTETSHALGGFARVDESSAATERELDALRGDIAALRRKLDAGVSSGAVE